MKILVTGGSRGIGKSIVEKFIKHGHDIWYPTRKELNLSNKIYLNNPKYDIIVNNAGINPLQDIINISDEEVMRVNYFSPFETGISRTSVLNGYTSTLVPDAATVVRVQSAGKCDNFIDIKVSN